MVSPMYSNQFLELITLLIINYINLTLIVYTIRPCSSITY